MEALVSVGLVLLAVTGVPLVVLRRRWLAPRAPRGFCCT